MEQAVNISRLTKERPRGQPTNKMNYKLYFYDPMKTEYNYLGEYTTLLIIYI